MLHFVLDKLDSLFDLEITEQKFLRELKKNNYYLQYSNAYLNWAN